MNRIAFTLPVLLAISACASMPSGPSVMVLPGSAKTFEQFRGDDLVCRDFAQAQLGGGSPDQASMHSGVRSAAVGTVLGAALGAAIDGGRGAGAGAGAGLALGGLSGTGAAQASAGGAQRRYDIGYQQCMYAKGHKVPIAGRFMTESRLSSYPPPTPPPSTTAPPPVR